MILVTYDVDFTETGGQKRLRKAAKLCENYGVRVQNSVFELVIDNSQYVTLKSEMAKIIDEERDSVRFYRIGKSWERKVEKLGKQEGIDQTGVLIL